MQKHSWQSAILKSNLPTITQLVLHTLSFYMDKTGGVAIVSYRDLAEDIGVTRRTIINHVNIAVEKGYLERFKRKREDGGNTINAFKPLIPNVKNKDGV